MKRSVSNSNSRLNEKTVFKEFKMIPYFVSIENLKTLINFISVIIHKRLPSRHYVNTGV